MALLTGTWVSKNGKDLGDGGTLKRNNIDTNDLIRIDPLGIVYYDLNNNWSIDSSDTVIGSLVYTSTLAKKSGILTQDSDNPTLFKFGANTSDQGKGLLVIFNQTFLKGLSFTPPPPVIPQTVKPQPATLKSDLEATLKNTTNVKEFINNNLLPATTVNSNSSTALKEPEGSEIAESNVVLSGSDNINATGNTSDNYIVGNSGNNTLDGGQGNDVLIGGVGNDTYVVDTIYDTLVELADEGVDTVISAISYILPKNFENLTLSGSATNGTGNDSSNIITGNTSSNNLYGLAGDDTLDGKGGNDDLFGGIGNDTYYVYSLSDRIYENKNEGDDKVLILIPENGSYKIPSNIERASLEPNSNVIVIGNELSNDITGNSNDNILHGDVSDTAPGDDHILGLAGNDIIYAMNGNDYLDGGTGVDTLYGGRGNDTYIVDDVGDQVIENIAQGQDLVQSSVSYILPSNVEGLELRGTANLIGIGNSLDNIIKGNSGDNLIDGLVGKDILTGLGGADNFQFSNKPTNFTNSLVDHITDFSPNEDRISVSKTAFGLASSLTVSLRSISNTASLIGALASSDLFIYDFSSGSLYLNLNGPLAGAGTGGIITIVDNKPTLTATNLTLY